jgi:hypothetical protein
MLESFLNIGLNVKKIGKNHSHPLHVQNRG